MESSSSQVMLNTTAARFHFQLSRYTRYLIRAYPIECREQFAFVADLTIRGNAALLRLGVTLVAAPPIAAAAPG